MPVYPGALRIADYPLIVFLAVSHTVLTPVSRIAWQAYFKTLTQHRLEHV